jgi:hypothetical protein
LPDPGPDPLNEIHDVPDEVQAHVERVVTLTVPLPPLGGMLIVSGATVYVHVAAGWEMTKLLPAIVSVADLDCVVVLAVAVSPMLPGPVSVPPLVIVTHDEPLVAVHVQLAFVVTLIVLLPPAAVNV